MRARSEKSEGEKGRKNVPDESTVVHSEPYLTLELRKIYFRRKERLGKRRTYCVSSETFFTFRLCYKRV